MGWRIHTSPHDIRSIVFDLDGTLYVSPGIAREIENAAEELVAMTRGITVAEGRGLIRAARSRLSEILEEEPTLTLTCLELGIEVDELHRAFQAKVRPEKYLEADPVLGALLDSLRERCDLYVYTNNNLPLARKILALLGVEEQFRSLYTIEFCRRPKPDPEALRQVLENIGGAPESFLFVGDRADVDLKPANALGIPTILVAETADLLQIHKLLGLIP